MSNSLLLKKFLELIVTEVICIISPKPLYISLKLYFVKLEFFKDFGLLSFMFHYV